MPFIYQTLSCLICLFAIMSQVFTYGSVPLKTYLPDGDIDFTVIDYPSVDETLVRDVLSLLHREEKNENAEFQVKDTQFIDAEVIFISNRVPMSIDSCFSPLFF